MALLVMSRSKPICKVQDIIRGSETTDNVHFMLTEYEKKELLNTYPISSKFIVNFKVEEILPTII